MRRWRVTSLHIQSEDTNLLDEHILNMWQNDVTE